MNETSEESMSIKRLQSYNYSSCVLEYRWLSLIKHEAVIHGKKKVTVLKSAHIEPSGHLKTRNFSYVSIKPPVII